MKNTILVFLIAAAMQLNAQQYKLVLPVGHTSNLHTAKLSPDQKRLVTSSSDGTARVWTADGHLLFALSQNGEPISYAAFRPDGRQVVTVSDAGKIAIWDAQTGILQGEMEGGDRSISEVYMTPDGKRVLTTSYSTDNVRIHFPDDATKDLTLEGHKAKITSLHTNALNTRIVTSSEDKTAIVWNNEGEQLIVLNHEGSVTRAEFSPDSKLIITASLDSTVKIWNAETGSLVRTLKEDNDAMNGAVFHPGGKTFATYSDNLIKTWDLQSNKPVSTVKTYASFNYLKYSSDGSKLLCFSRGGSAITYDPNTGNLIAEMKIDDYLGPINSATFVIVYEAEFSPDGRSVITAGADNSAMMWNAANGELLTSFTSRVKPVVCYSVDTVSQKVVTGHEDGSVKLWDVKTGRLEKSFSGHHNWILSVAFSKDYKHIVSGGRDGALSIWDIATGKQVKEESAHDNWIIATSYSADNKRILTGSWDHTAVIRNAEGKALFTLKHNGNVQDALFSRSGNKIISASDSTVAVWSAADGKIIRKFKMPDRVYFPELSADETKLLAVSADDYLRVYNLLTGALIAKKQFTGLGKSKFLKNGRQVVVSSNESGVVLWDIASGTTGHVFTEAPDVRSIKFNNDYSKMVVTTESGIISVFEMAGNQLVKEYDLKEAYLQSAEMMDDHRLVAILNYGIKYFDLRKDAPFYTAVPLDSADYVTRDEKGFYQSTPKAAGLLHYLTDDNKIINFEQLDVKFNRPDLLLRSIGSSDTSRIQSYYRAYAKRIKKLGVDTSSFGDGFAVPEASIVNADELSYEQNKAFVQIKFSAKDSLYDLDRFSVSVNECPLFGMKGISIRNSSSRNFDTVITIALSDGKNVIQASVTNQNGTESYRMPLTLFYTPPTKGREKMHFIGIGIDRFKEPGHKLNYSVKDVHDLAIRLKEKYREDITIDTLFNEDVTVANVSLLKKKLLSTSISDKVIVSYSGHGLLSKDFDYYLSAYEVEFTNPENGGLPYDLLESLLDSIPARQKLMLIDACHSGEVDKEEMQNYKRVMNSNANPGLKGGELENIDPTAKLGMKNSFELMQELFANVGRSTGATIISAAAGTQLAQERGDLKNGVFTYSILEFMEQNPTATVTELKNYVNKRVPELTNGLQVPTTRTETKMADWKVW